jgi:hypothetical protein
MSGSMVVNMWGIKIIIASFVVFLNKNNIAIHISTIPSAIMKDSKGHIFIIGINIKSSLTRSLAGDTPNNFIAPNQKNTTKSATWASRKVIFLCNIYYLFFCKYT